MYEDFYGLTGKPFQLTPDPAFYFESTTHRKALSYLGYGLTQGEGFIVITGEVGAGKSTLVGHLVARVDKTQLTVGQVVTSKLDGDEIIHVVAQSFGLEIEGHDKASALGAIERFLHEEARAGRRCLLIVDEAQNLSVAALEELRMLSNFQLGSHPLLQALLLGQPEFRATLQGHPTLEQLRQRVIATHHLEPMVADEIEPYVVHRMKCAGWTGNPAFEQSVYDGLFEATGGIPRRLNQVLNRLLLLGAVEQRTTIDVPMLKAVLAETESDNTVPSVAANESELPQDQAAVEPHAPPPATPAFDAQLVENLISTRDAQIAELQQAVVELAQAQEETALSSGQRELAGFDARLAKLETQMAEQEQAIRHTLTMLIEWVEKNGHAAIAA